MTSRIQSESLQQALSQGYKVAQLWDLHTRVVSSNEKLNAKGSLMAGTVYVEWAYWLNSNIKTHAFIAVLDNGTEFNQANFEDLHSSLGITAPPVLTQGGTQFDVKLSGHDSEDQSSTVGLVSLYLVYLDNDDWVKVFDGNTDGTTSRATFDVLKDKDFYLMFQENMDYEWALFSLKGPIPAYQKHLRCDFKGAEMDVSMPTPTTCTVAITNRNLDKVWIKYV